MNHLKKSLEVATTHSISEVSNMLLGVHKKLKEQAQDSSYQSDSLLVSPYIMDTTGTVKAVYSPEQNAVGFYYEDGRCVKSLKHVGSASEISGLTWEYLKDTEVNVLTEALPSGDILVYTATDGEAHSLNGEYSVVEFMEESGLDVEDILKIVYLGLSTKEPVVELIEFEDVLREYFPEEEILLSGNEDEGEEEEECTFPHCNCNELCQEYKEKVLG